MNGSKSPQSTPLPASGSAGPTRRQVLKAMVGVAVMGLTDVNVPAAPAEKWWKGNLHTHTLWSDGDEFPELVAAWYKEHGYDFLALTDHNEIQQGERWVDAARIHPLVLANYRQRVGASRFVERTANGKHEIRLCPFKEYAQWYGAPGRFLLIQGDELSLSVAGRPVHLNALNAGAPLAQRTEEPALKCCLANIELVNTQSRRLDRPMLATVNHPNFRFSLTAEDLAGIEGTRFFEVFNAHPEAVSHGDAEHPSVERLWDIALSLRLAQGKGLLYGTGVDDAHHYHEFNGRAANPGRAWVMVRAARLTPEALFAAMNKGDFYASTGVQLRELHGDGKGIHLRIEPEEDVSYTTRFIGTRRGVDLKSAPALGADGKPLHGTRRYSGEIGKVLAEIKGTHPRYAFKGDELYVRAQVISTKRKANPFAQGDVECAWIQPVCPAQER